VACARSQAYPPVVSLLDELRHNRESLFDLCALGDELTDALGRRVDVLTEAALSPYLRTRIVAEAVPL
jgi:predicted nucleotidyltransferase